MIGVYYVGLRCEPQGVIYITLAIPEYIDFVRLFFCISFSLIYWLLLKVLKVTNGPKKGSLEWGHIENTFDSQMHLSVCKWDVKINKRF